MPASRPACRSGRSRSTDEVAIDLALKIVKATKAQVGEAAVNPLQEKLLVTMVEHEDGSAARTARASTITRRMVRNALWPGLKDLQPAQREGELLDIEDSKQRLLVLAGARGGPQRRGGRDHRSARGGRRLDPRVRFRALHGRRAQLHRLHGTSGLVDLCRKLQAKHGDRFAPPRILIEMAASGGTFYGGAQASKAAFSDASRASHTRKAEQRTASSPCPTPAPLPIRSRFWSPPSASDRLAPCFGRGSIRRGTCPRSDSACGRTTSTRRFT